MKVLTEQTVRIQKEGFKIDVILVVARVTALHFSENIGGNDSRIYSEFCRNAVVGCNRACVSCAPGSNNSNPSALSLSDGDFLGRGRKIWCGCGLI